MDSGLGGGCLGACDSSFNNDSGGSVGSGCWEATGGNARDGCSIRSPDSSLGVCGNACESTGAALTNNGYTTRLRRTEFVDACEAMLANSQGNTTAADFHDLFDMLDAQGAGSISMSEFTGLLRAFQEPGHAGPVPSSDIGLPDPPYTPFLPKANAPSVLAGLRAWMLSQNWIIQDLINCLGGASLSLDWEEFQTRLLGRVKAPWLMQHSARELFDLFAVRGHCRLLGGSVDKLRVAELIAALLENEAFAIGIAQQCLRILCRGVQRQKEDIRNLCQLADKPRSGLLDIKQLSSVFNEACPSTFSDADMACAFRRFCNDSSTGVPCETLVAAFEGERREFWQHLFLRALPPLQRQAAGFQAQALALDVARSGALTAAQLARALHSLELGLSESDRGEELDELTVILAHACAQDVNSFKYGTVVANGIWVGPTVAKAIEKLCASECSTDDASAASGWPAPKQYLLPLLYYKIAEGASKLRLALDQAFDRLDRGGKGHLDADDLRRAVLEMLGEDATLVDLGLNSGSRVSPVEFQRLTDFDMRPLSANMFDVFNGEDKISERSFCSRLHALGVPETTAMGWLQLIYPAGLLAGQVGRSGCQAFLATHPNLASSDGAGLSDPLRKVCTRLRSASPTLRCEIKDRVAPAGDWLDRRELAALLQEAFLPKAEVEVLLQAVGDASAAYPVVAGVDSSTLVRTETLLSCAESYEECLLDVRFVRLTGLQNMRSKAVPEDAALPDLVLGYRLHGCEHAAEIPIPAEDMDFTAAHTFGLSARDNLAALFQNLRGSAITIQAWAVGGAYAPRQLVAVAGLPASELVPFLQVASTAANGAEVLLGSQREWTLSFKTPPASNGEASSADGDSMKAAITIAVRYSRRPPADSGKPPVPWSCAFAGRLVLCTKPSALVTPLSMPLPAAPRAYGTSQGPTPEPGSVQFELHIPTIELKMPEVRSMVAQCYRGVALQPESLSKGLLIYVRAGLFPLDASPRVGRNCGWVTSSPKMLGNVVLPDSQSTSAVSYTLDLDFSWRSSPLSGAEAMAVLSEGLVSLELWLRMDCELQKPGPGVLSTGSNAADMRLGEAEMKLDELLRKASPEAPGELCLRVLRRECVQSTVNFKQDRRELAAMKVAVALDVPNGPTVISWLVKAPPNAKPQQTYAATTEYDVKLEEIILCRDFVTSLATADPARTPDASSFASGSSTSAISRFPAPASATAVTTTPVLPATAAAAAAAAQSQYFFYTELFEQRPGQDRLQAAPLAQRYRSPPVEGTLDGAGWLRVPFGEDARIVLPKRPSKGSSKEVDIEIERGEHHGLRLGVFCLSGNRSQLIAEARVQLPTGDRSEGLPSLHFAGRIWVALLYAAPDAPSLCTVGRALFKLQAESSTTDAQRSFSDIPSMPSGVFLPLYKNWVPAPGNAWPHAELASLALGDDLWSKLADGGEVPTCEQFETALATTGAGYMDDILHFRAALGPFFMQPTSPIPSLVLLQWLVIRRLARQVLPKAMALLRRFKQMDRGTRGGSSSATGALPLALVQEALKAEVPDISPAMWEFLTTRRQWSVNPECFYGHSHFDYSIFLWDLQASGIPFPAAQTLCTDPPLPKSPTPSLVAANLGVKSPPPALTAPAPVMAAARPSPILTPPAVAAAPASTCAAAGSIGVKSPSPALTVATPSVGRSLVFTQPASAVATATASNYEQAMHATVPAGPPPPAVSVPATVTAGSVAKASAVAPVSGVPTAVNATAQARLPATSPTPLIGACGRTSSVLSSPVLPAPSIGTSAASIGRPALPMAGVPAISRAANLMSAASSPVRSPEPEGPRVRLVIARGTNIVGGKGLGKAGFFISYEWRSTHEEWEYAGTTGELGSTPVVYESKAPVWDHSQILPLPPYLLVRGKPKHYPDAFRELSLHLRVWQLDMELGNTQLLGSCRVALGPLQHGFDEIDGYFHIESGEDLGVARMGLQDPRGQLRVFVKPMLTTLENKVEAGHMQRNLVVPRPQETPLPAASVQGPLASVAAIPPGSPTSSVVTTVIPTATPTSHSVSASPRLPGMLPAASATAISPRPFTAPTASVTPGLPRPGAVPLGATPMRPLAAAPLSPGASPRPAIAGTSMSTPTMGWPPAPAAAATPPLATPPQVSPIRATEPVLSSWFLGESSVPSPVTWSSDSAASVERQSISTASPKAGMAVAPRFTSPMASPLSSPRPLAAVLPPSLPQAAAALPASSALPRPPGAVAAAALPATSPMQRVATPLATVPGAIPKPAAAAAVVAPAAAFPKPFDDHTASAPSPAASPKLQAAASMPALSSWFLGARSVPSPHTWAPEQLTPAFPSALSTPARPNISPAIPTVPTALARPHVPASTPTVASTPTRPNVSSSVPGVPSTPARPNVPPAPTLPAQPSATAAPAPMKASEGGQLDVSPTASSKVSAVDKPDVTPEDVANAGKQDAAPMVTPDVDPVPKQASTIGETISAAEPALPAKPVLPTAALTRDVGPQGDSTPALIPCDPLSQTHLGDFGPEPVAMPSILASDVAPRMSSTPDRLVESSGHDSKGAAGTEKDANRACSRGRSRFPDLELHVQRLDRQDGSSLPKSIGGEDLAGADHLHRGLLPPLAKPSLPSMAASAVFGGYGGVGRAGGSHGGIFSLAASPDVSPKYTGGFRETVSGGGKSAASIGAGVRDSDGPGGPASLRHSRSVSSLSGGSGHIPADEPANAVFGLPRNHSIRKAANAISCARAFANTISAGQLPPIERAGSRPRTVGATADAQSNGNEAGVLHLFGRRPASVAGDVGLSRTGSVVGDSDMLPSRVSSSSSSAQIVGIVPAVSQWDPDGIATVESRDESTAEDGIYSGVGITIEAALSNLDISTFGQPSSPTRLEALSDIGSPRHDSRSDVTNGESIPWRPASTVIGGDSMFGASSSIQDSSMTASAVFGYASQRFGGSSASTTAQDIAADDEALSRVLGCPTKRRAPGGYTGAGSCAPTRCGTPLRPSSPPRGVPAVVLPPPLLKSDDVARRLFPSARDRVSDSADNLVAPAGSGSSAGGASRGGSGRGWPSAVMRGAASPGGGSTAG